MYIPPPAVEFATGQASIKGEDFLLVQPKIIAPKNVDIPAHSSHNLHLSDSASSQNGILQESMELKEKGRSSSLGSKRSSDRMLHNAGPATFGLFCVMDGHNGKAAAQHLQSNLAATLQERLPSGAAPSESNKGAFSNWCDDIQKAIISTFNNLNEEFACRGELAGTTATVVLQHGWHLTVANLGDSRAILDVGNEEFDLSEDHRVATHQEDRRRLEGMGAVIAPIDYATGHGPAPRGSSAGYGPLRVWPGGSALSRGIGDFDIGPPIIACPFITQVRIPETGGRVILASDGVWDGFESIKKLLKISRIYNCQTAPDKIIHCVRNAYGGLKDDTSLVVLDVMPSGASFVDLAKLHARKTIKSRTLAPRRSSSSGCLCFSPSPDMVKDDDSYKPPKPISPPDILIRIDVAEAVGLMTQPLNLPPEKIPSWCVDEFCDSVRLSEEAACKAWQEAHNMRSMGRTPSRMDLESFFSAVHAFKPLEDVSTRPPTMEEQRGLDITARPRSISVADSQQFKTTGMGMPRSKSKKHVHFPKRDSMDGSMDGSSQHSQNASQHFKDHVVQPGSYPRKFGLYKAHMDESGGGDSSTEDDSHRPGSYSSSPFGTPTRDTLLSDEAQETYGSPQPMDIPRRRSHGSFESSHGSSLPTVAEETPANPSKTSLAPGQRLEDIMNETAKTAPGNEGQEGQDMAVRGGKNRFTIEANGGLEAAASTGSLKASNGRPPLAGQRISP